MSEIYATTIGTNRYAAPGAEAVELYTYNCSEDLTLSQLVVAISVRRAAQLERATVVQQNLMGGCVEMMEQFQADMKTVLSDSGVSQWAAIRARLRQAGVADSDLPATIKEYDDKLKAAEQIKTLLEQYNSTVERQAIELQTCLSRRDNIYNLATTCVQRFGKTAQSVASNF